MEAMRRSVWVVPMVALISISAAGRVQPALRTAGGLGLNPVHAAAVERALAGAARRLDDPGCRQIFSEFRDGAGAPLQTRLDALGVSGKDYLSLVHFADGSTRRTCHRGGVAALTAPGSRVVYVCGRLFQEVAARSAARAEIVVLHEALHTLGLGENPPDSLTITRRVGERCGG
jgi:hypothetical protein